MILLYIKRDLDKENNAKFHFRLDIKIILCF